MALVLVTAVASCDNRGPHTSTLRHQHRLQQHPNQSLLLIYRHIHHPNYKPHQGDKTRRDYFSRLDFSPTERVQSPGRTLFSGKELPRTFFRKSTFQDRQVPSRLSRYWAANNYRTPVRPHFSN